MHLNNRARDLLDKYSSGMAQQFGARDRYQSDELADPACDWCRCLTCCRLLATD